MRVEAGTSMQQQRLRLRLEAIAAARGGSMTIVQLDSHPHPLKAAKNLHVRIHLNSKLKSKTHYPRQWL